MTIENSSERNLGWFHPGFCLSNPQVIRSTEHRRRLEHVDAVARGLINLSLTTACLAQAMGTPYIEASVPAGEKTHGWRRIRVHETDGDRSGKLLSVREVLGSVSLTERAYQDVQAGRSEGNTGTSVLLNIAAESGFRDPSSLLYALPVVSFDSVDSAPAERLTPYDHHSNLEQVYGLLPDINIAVQQAVAAIATGANVRE